MLKRILLIPLLALALSTGGCALVQKADDFVSSAASALASPVNMYRVKLTYDVALAGANKYQDWCWGVRPNVTVRLTYAEIMTDPVGRALCQTRRATVRTMQTAKAKARVAINAAEDFGANPPTNLVAAAWSAVGKFQSVVDAKRVP